MAVELLLIGVWVDAVIGSFSDVVTVIVIVLECVVLVSYFVEDLSDVVVKS